MSDRQMERALEWEAAAKPQVFELVQWPVPPFMPTVSKLTVERDENLQLSLLAEGTVTVPGEQGRRHREAKKVPLGTFFPMTQLSLAVYGNQLDLKCHVEDEPSSSHTTAQGTTFEQRGFVETMRFGFRQKAIFVDEDGPQFAPLDAVGWRSDWYVNGSTRLRFPRETKRRQLGSFKRERPFLAVAIDECPRGPRSMDHILVDTPMARFAYCKVPEGEAPKGLSAVGIDYLPPIPDADVREAIGEIVSFVVGRRMMRVGSTTYDVSGSIIEEESVNPWGSNVRELCRRSDLPPVEFSYDGLMLEELLADLIPRYLANRERLGLKEALWSYWIAKESPPSVDLPIFAAAVEGLKKRWFASEQSPSGGLHLTLEAFEKVAGDLVTELRKRVETERVPDEIVRTVAGANRMGLGEQMRVFLREIGLPIGKREKAAMKARHLSAHGASVGEELTELIRLGNAYRTLFDRVFLRLLGYEGSYVDRTTEGHPSRPLLTPAGDDTGG